MLQNRVYPADPVDNLGDPQVNDDTGESQGFLARYAQKFAYEPQHISECQPHGLV